MITITDRLQEKIERGYDRLIPLQPRFPSGGKNHFQEQQSLRKQLSIR